MAAKKIMLFLVPVFLLAFSIILTSSIFSLPSLTTKGITGKQIQRIVNKVDFSQWRDETSDPGFNSLVSVGTKGLVVATGQAAFGKTMSSLRPIALHITKDLQLVAEVDRLSPGGKATLRIMNANEPYETFDLVRIEKPGAYTANLYDLTKWQGDTNLWLELWLEGKNESLALKNISFLTFENSPATVQTKPAKKYAWLAGLTGRKYLFQKDFSAGADDWRGNRTDAGFNTLFTLDGGVPRFKLLPDCRNGKVLSPTPGIRGNLTSKTEFSVEIQDLGGLRAKIDLMETKPPYETRTILDWISRPGTYKARVAQKTGWKGQKTFWIQMWLEPAAKPEGNAAGVAVKRMLIRE